MPRVLITVALLFCSNTFMTFAWYYHVIAGQGQAQKKQWPLLVAIGVSWLIALPEYIFQVPANRVGSLEFGGPLALPQLKIIQEAITLVVFTAFCILVAKERVRATDYLAMLLVMAAVGLSMYGRQDQFRAGSASSAGVSVNPSGRSAAQ